MDTWLTTQAAIQMWQHPSADGQIIAAPARVSSNEGFIGTGRVGREVIKMPFDGWGHLYDFGMFHPQLGSLRIAPRTWVRGTTLVNTYQTYMQVYADTGMCFPLHHAYFARTSNGSLVMALPIKNTFSWVEKARMFLRIYSGYNRIRDDIPYVNVQYFNLGSLSARSDVYSKYITAKSKGYTTVTINGRIVKDLAVADINLWDEIELLTDNRITRVVDFRTGDLATFNSSMDSIRKYLLHLPKTSEMTFSDDVKIQVFGDKTGLYYNMHKSNYLRQLTHGDFSIPTNRITEIADEIGGVIDLDEVTIRVLIKDSRIDKQVVYNSDKVHELYKLSDELIIDAMTGANSTIPEWRAVNIEKSPVNRIMASKLENITVPLAAEAYGYNAISRLAAPSPVKTIIDNGMTYVSLKGLNSVSSTVYEYVNGVLVDWHLNHNSDLYYCHEPAATLVEPILGVGSNRLSVAYGHEGGALQYGLSYGFWLEKKANGVLTGVFTKAVEDADYIVDNGVITWFVDTDRVSPTLIDNSRHLVYRQDFVVSDGAIAFTIQHNRNGAPVPLHMPMETVELWLNNKPLVQGIDYHVEWPLVVVVAKPFITQEELTHTVTIRCRGVSSTLKSPKFGYVANGLFSENSTWDLRDDKVVRIVAGGKILSRSQVAFREDTSVGAPNIPDGTPYSIDDPTIPLGELIHVPLKDYRKIAHDLDQRIEGYLSIYSPTPPVNDVVDLPHYYHLFSPTLNKIMHDLINGEYVPVKDDETHVISTRQLDEVMGRYQHLLKHDPAYIGYDDRFSVVHPHWYYRTITLSELEYALMERVNRRYLNNVVQLNQYIKIGQR